MELNFEVETAASLGDSEERAKRWGQWWVSQYNINITPITQQYTTIQRQALQPMTAENKKSQ
ncbi:unnamed protein product [Prunus brigantina]